MTPPVSRNHLGIPVIVLGAFVVWFCGVQVVSDGWEPFLKWGLASGVSLIALGGLIAISRR